MEICTLAYMHAVRLAYMSTRILSALRVIDNFELTHVVPVCVYCKNLCMSKQRNDHTNEALIV